MNKDRIENKERIAKFFMALLITFSLASIVTTVPGAASPSPEPPNSNETQLLDAIIARLRANSASWPYDISDVLNSLDARIQITFNCQNSKVTGVNIGIRTRQAHWNETEYPNITGAVGYYLWDQQAIINGGTKSIAADNEIMLNETEFNESSQFDMLQNEAAVYHELLHGQLLIDAMKVANGAWRNESCNCSFNYSVGGVGSDTDPAAVVPHAQIYELEAKYIKNAAAAHGYNVTMLIDTFNSNESTFDVNVSLVEYLDGKEINETSVTSMSDNVQIDSFNHTEYGKFRITGSITGGQGKIRLLVDPPAISIIDDITIIYTSSPPVTPSPSPTNGSTSGGGYIGTSNVYDSLSSLGLIILIICLTAITTLKFKKKI